MNKKVAFIIVFLLILIVAGAGFLRWQNQKKVDIEKRVEIQQQLEQESKKQEEKKQNQQDSIEIFDNDWMIYHSEKYGFQVKIPKDWDVIVRSSDPNRPERKDSFIFQKKEHLYFAVFTNGGFGYGIQKPKKIINEKFGGKEAKKYWYNNTFPNFILFSEIPRGWNNENMIEIRAENSDGLTLDTLQSMYESFQFVE